MEGKSSVDKNAERLQAAASQLELHAIFYRHQEVSDAEESVSLIDNDSIVYLEGIRFDPIETLLLSDEVEAIGNYKCLYGKDEVYYRMKEELVGEITNYLENGDKSDENFDSYTATKYKLLLEKDCRVVIADYRHQINPQSQSYYDKLTAKVKQTVGERQHDIFRSVVSESNTNKQLRKLKKHISNEFIVHDMREQIATDFIIHDVADIVSNPEADMNILRTPSGKIKSYLIYGTAHARSLTNKIADRGIEVITHEPIPLQSTRYLDLDREMHAQNYARTLALVALSGISWQLIADPDDDQYDGFYQGTMDLVYKAFDNVRLDRKGGVSIAKYCLDLMKMFDNDPNESRRLYLELLREQGAV